MSEPLRLRPENPIFGGGRLQGLFSALDLFGKIKEYAASLNIEVSRLVEIMPAIDRIRESDWHTLEGMRAGLSAALTIADVLALDEATVSAIQETIDGASLNVLLWLFNKLTGYQPAVEQLLDVEALSLPDLSKLAPILQLIFTLLELLGKR